MSSDIGARYRLLGSPEGLAYWYFRLNGFMSIENFLVHPERGGNPRTDVDLLATRFAHRRENVITPMEDDRRVAECKTFANIIIAEVKTGRCALNGPWTNPNDENMERVLRSIGCAWEDEIAPAAQSLYETGRWSNDVATVRLFALGEWINDRLPIGRDQQIEWKSVIDFCVDRFRKYRTQKSSMGQWAPDGKRLRDLALQNDVHSIRAIREYFDLRPESAPH